MGGGGVIGVKSHIFTPGAPEWGLSVTEPLAKAKVTTEEERVGAAPTKASDISVPREGRHGPLGRKLRQKRLKSTIG